MNRRNFIKTVIVGAAGVSVPLRAEVKELSGCSSGMGGWTKVGDTVHVRMTGRTNEAYTVTAEVEQVFGPTVLFVNGKYAGTL